MNRFVIVLSFIFGLFCLPVFAETQPRQGQHDTRVRQAIYQDGQVYRIRTSLTHVTSIEFGRGEVIRKRQRNPLLALDF